MGSNAFTLAGSYYYAALHIRPGEILTADIAEAGRVGWVDIGPLPVFCPDPETAEHIADAFAILADKMREAKRAEDGPSYGEVTDPAGQNFPGIEMAPLTLASHDPDDRR